MGGIRVDLGARDGCCSFAELVFQGKRGEVDHPEDESEVGGGYGITDDPAGTEGAAAVIDGDEKGIAGWGDCDISKPVAGEIVHGIGGIDGAVDGKAVGF